MQHIPRDRITLPGRHLVISAGVTRKQVEKRGYIGRCFEEHIEGLDLGKEEDINTLCGMVGKAKQKGAKAFGDLMRPWED